MYNAQKMQKVVKQSAWYSIAGILNKIILLGLLGIFGRLVVPADFKLLDILEPAELFVASLLCFGLPQAFVKLFKEAQFDREAVISTLFTATFCISIFFTLTFALLAPIILPFLVLRVTEIAYYAYFFVLLSLFLRFWYQWYAQFLAADNRLVLLEGGNLLGTTAYCLYSGIALWFMQRNLQAVFEARLLLLLPVVLGGFWLYRRQIRFHIDREILKKALDFGFPLIFAGGAYQILNFVDRWLIQYFLNDTQTGIYGFAYRFGMIPLMVLTTPFSKAWIPAMYENALSENQSELYKRLLLYYTLSACFLCLGLGTCAPELLRIFGKTQYASGYVVVAPVAIGLAIYGLGWVVMAGLAVQSKSGFIGLWTSIAAFVNIALNIWWIPRFGIEGAAWATCLSFVFLFLGFMGYSHKFLHIKWQYIRFFGLIFGTTIAYFCISPITFGGDIVNIIGKGVLCALAMLLLSPISGLTLKRLKGI